MWVAPGRVAELLLFSWRVGRGMEELCSVAVWMICLTVEGLLLFNPPSATGGGRAVE
jgi:hypothetical protein